MDTPAYSVKTPVFEGPLDLLLDLVEKRKLFVSDVSLAQVTDDFISYLEREEQAGRLVPLGESAEFIVIASTLMLVKSRSLLPALELTGEEEASIEELESRLSELKRMRELSIELRKMFGTRTIFEKRPSKTEAVVFSPDKRTSVGELQAALRSVLESLPKKELVPKAIVRKMISLEETIEKLSERISKGVRLRFADFAGSLGSGGELTHEKKVSIIVGFLAMLELVKRGAIRVSQEGREIDIESETLGTPVYA